MGSRKLSKAYHGPGLTNFAIRSSNNGGSICNDKENFAVVNVRPVPRGLSIAAYRSFKKVLRTNSYRNLPLAQGISEYSTEEFDENSTETEPEAAEFEQLAKAQTGQTGGDSDGDIVMENDGNTFFESDVEVVDLTNIKTPREELQNGFLKQQKTRPMELASPLMIQTPLISQIVQNKDALDFRAEEIQRAAEQELRRRQLRDSLQESGEMAAETSRLIINQTKMKEHELVFVDDHIAKYIMDHQIDGVRFMWNQVVANQGCLLAHTMGLGKTMQVITLLVAIAVTSQSSHGPTMVEQIPEPLRESKTLVLCTAGLVENWVNEFNTWSPPGVLGPLRKLDASLGKSERKNTVQDWAGTGGILVIGYSMLKEMVKTEEMKHHLTHSPSIVIADEAHHLKNPAARVTQVCASFKTSCRIALTGSPMSNNVEEYHAMIDWVAPNFLGPLSEFRDIYANPIQQGLYKDSTSLDKRISLKMLEVLKETVAPKMHRATMKCLQSKMPPKLEFVISLLPSEEQRSLYNMYIKGLDQKIDNNSGTNPKLIQQCHRLFTIIDDLRLICNHPTIFRKKALEVRTQVLNGESRFPPLIIESMPGQTEGASNPRLSRKVEYLLLILDEARKANDKVLVFSQSISTLDYLETILGGHNRRVARLDGSTAIAKRQDSTKDFNTGDLEVFLISTKAGGVGLNIQAANRVVIFDSGWNPVDDQQAVGRAWRIGQNRPVFVYRLVVAGTFEEDLLNKSIFKMQLASRLVDKNKPVSYAKQSSYSVYPIRDVERADTARFLGKDSVLDKLINHREEEGGAVLSVVETDIFEEEDPRETLTEEENKEIRDFVDLDRLRVSDPAKYKQIRAEMQAGMLMGEGSHLSGRLFDPGRSSPSFQQESDVTMVDKCFYNTQPLHEDGKLPIVPVLLSNVPSHSMPLSTSAADLWIMHLFHDADQGSAGQEDGYHDDLDAFFHAWGSG